jgi:hypothetical protein
MTAKKKTAKKADRYTIEFFYPLQRKWYRSTFHNEKKNGYTLKEASAILKEKATTSYSGCLKYRKVKIK